MARQNRIPFASTTSVTLAYVSASFAGSQAAFNTAPLTNNFRVPIEVTAIRVLVEPRASELVTDLVLASFVHLEAKIGKHYLTDGPVPISILAPYRKWEQNYEAFPTANDFSQLSMRTIYLPRPIYVRPGVGFSVTASIPANEFTTGTNLFASNFSAIVHVAIIGRFLGDNERIPETHEIPIVSFVQLSSVKKTSFETDLRNPLSKPIRVHRMTGSALISHTPGTEVMNESWDNLEATKIEIKFPDASPLTESPVEFVRLFGQMRTLPITFDLAENARIRAQVKDTLTSRRGLQIGIFGTRSEVVQ